MCCRRNNGIWVSTMFFMKRLFLSPNTNNMAINIPCLPFIKFHILNLVWGKKNPWACEPKMCRNIGDRAEKYLLGRRWSCNGVTAFFFPDHPCTTVPEQSGSGSAFAFHLTHSMPFSLSDSLIWWILMTFSQNFLKLYV